MNRMALAKSLDRFVNTAIGGARQGPELVEGPGKGPTDRAGGPFDKLRALCTVVRLISRVERRRIRDFAAAMV